MEQSHMVIIGLLIVILVVVVMARNKVRNEVSGLEARRQSLMAAARAEAAKLKGRLGAEYDLLQARHNASSAPQDDGPSTEHFNWSNAYNILEEQAQQKRELRDASFPTNTVFARLGNMMQTCQQNRSPQCDAFMKFAYSMSHPNQ